MNELLCYPVSALIIYCTNNKLLSTIIVIFLIFLKEKIKKGIFSIREEEILNSWHQSAAITKMRNMSAGAVEYIIIVYKV